MNFEWRQLRARHAWLFLLIVLGKRLRTKAAILVVAICVADGFYLKERPFDLVKPNIWVGLGLLLIAAGMFFRISAHGCLKKKEVLATGGIYSLCRHPLYLGSMLLTYGFCFLLDDIWNFVAATLYFGIFYTLTIIWEEIRLAERYGADHEAYCQTTPVLLPLGRFHADGFGWARAMRHGGAMLVGIVFALIVAVQVMAIEMHS